MDKANVKFISFKQTCFKINFLFVFFSTVEYGPYLLFCFLNVPIFVGCCFYQKYPSLLLLKSYKISKSPYFRKKALSQFSKRKFCFSFCCSRSGITTMASTQSIWFDRPRLRAPWWQDPDLVFISRASCSAIT